MYENLQKLSEEKDKTSITGSEDETSLSKQKQIAEESAQVLMKPEQYKSKMEKLEKCRKIAAEISKMWTC